MSLSEAFLGHELCFFVHWSCIIVLFINSDNSTINVQVPELIKTFDSWTAFEFLTNVILSGSK